MELSGLEYLRQREAWWRSLADQISDGLRRTWPTEERSADERAALFLYVAVGHLNGEWSRDLTIEGFLDEAAVARLTAHFRSRPSLPWYRELAGLWQGIVVFGSAGGRVAPELLLAWRSRLRRWLPSLDADSQYVGQPRIKAFIDRTNEAGHSAILGSLTTPDDVGHPLAPPESLVNVIRRLWTMARKDKLETASAQLLVELLPYEQFAAMPYSQVDAELDRLVELSMRIAVVENSMVGSWPDRRGNQAASVPTVVRSRVLDYGARHDHSVAGAVPHWIFVADSTEGLRSIRRFANNQAVGVYDENEEFELHLVLPSDGGRDPFHAIMYFGSRPEQLVELAVIATVGLIRLDIYSLDARHGLAYEGSMGLQLSPELTERVSGFVARWAQPGVLDAAVLLQSVMPDADAQAQAHAQFCENARFDLISDVLRQRIAGVELGETRREYLDAYAAVAASEWQMADRPELAAIQDRYQELVAVERRRTAVADAVRDLGAGRAFVYVELREHLQAVACWLDEDDRARFETIDCSMPVDLEVALPGAADLPPLVALIANVRSLHTEHGLTDLVLSPGRHLYGVPLDAMLTELGFNRVSYAPSLDVLSLQSRRSTPRTQELVIGWPGSDPSARGFLHAVQVECELVASFYDTLPLTDLRQDVGSCRLLHIAGHGATGPTIGSAGVSLEGQFLTGSLVLRDFNLTGIELVVLAACSTSAQTYTEDQPLEAPALDVCFLGAGARVVISTLRPVHDLVSLLFSAQLHTSLRAGDDVWSAFSAARTAAANYTLPSDAIWRQAVLNHIPDIKEQLSRLPDEARGDWALFRLSGRYWD